MAPYSFNERKILEAFPTVQQRIGRGRELREKGYRLIHHGIWPDSIETPSGEFFDKTRMHVRHSMVEDTTEIEMAFEYLLLCEKTLRKVLGNELGFTLS